jgi:hypothetical protein
MQDKKFNSETTRESTNRNKHCKIINNINELIKGLFGIVMLCYALAT